MVGRWVTIPGDGTGWVTRGGAEGSTIWLTIGGATIGGAEGSTVWLTLSLIGVTILISVEMNCSSLYPS